VDRFGRAFVFEVGSGSLAEVAHVGADNIVCGGVVVGGTPEDACADFLFGEMGAVIAEGALADEEQQFLEASSSPEGCAGGNPLEEFPTAFRIQSVMQQSCWLWSIRHGKPPLFNLWGFGTKNANPVSNHRPESPLQPQPAVVKDHCNDTDALVSCRRTEAARRTIADRKSKWNK
jgi:hypothetical protein